MKNKIPLYHKVYDYLLKKIEKEFNPGDLLPTQSEIAKETETSLITVKRAIKELEAMGYVESKAGKGTTVKKPQIVDSHVGVSSWTDSIIGQGKVPSTAWTKIEKKAPTHKVAAVLGLKARQKTVYVERLRLIDNRPICLMYNEMPMHLVPGFNDEIKLEESIYSYLEENYGLIGVSADEEVYAREATAYEINILKLKSPIVLVIERTSYLQDDTPYESSCIIAAADSYVYRSRQINKTVDTEILRNLLTE
ncbi:GntR family transcriptional regulator [Zobellia uliginosa]|uniref:GntR family transcriptional regulator n=1 Tax=Zobellia uliginosa TaxID=143224 RepID=UPI0026E2E143|nr:GntR family transcriptional regulator [Zobellia uliginosa]MDO6519442.1 GntR family transcriptional regulator [Zobellia uliginosa]